MSLALDLLRPDLRDFAPYASAGREASSDLVIKLDANENRYAPLASFGDVNLYPEPQPVALRRRLADLYGVGEENVLVSRGADEAIDLLIRAFCRPAQDAILIAPPTFGYYETAARLQGAIVLRAPLSANFEFDFDAAGKCLENNPDAKLAFLCSPMNPTGGLIEPSALLAFCDAHPRRLIVVDEAYVEFSSAPSLSGAATRRENLVVLRTLSKAYGLAGARIGACIANADVIDMLRRIIAPYPIARPSITAAKAALSPSRLPIVFGRIDEMKSERERVFDALAKSGEAARVFPSEANFVYFEARDPLALQERLRRSGVKLRMRPDASPAGMRFSIGTPAENDIALSAICGGFTPTARRASTIVRDTKETQIALALDLDEEAPVKIDTGISFFDHMLEQIARHGRFSLILKCVGDLDVDAHHSVEDCALAIGAALKDALGDKTGVARYGAALPMDEADARVLIDLSGRPLSKFTGEFRASHIGAYPTEMTAHFFRSLSDSLGAAIHVEVTGENDHHKTEAAFKAFGRALRGAIAREGTAVPSTKGVL